MKFRSGLLAATFLLTPIALQAQTLGYPVSGLYIGAAGGFNIKANPSVKNLSSSLSTGTGISTPNASRRALGRRRPAQSAMALATGCGSNLSTDMQATPFRGSVAIIAVDLVPARGPVAVSRLAARWSILTMTSLASLRGWFPTLASGIGYQRARLSDFSTVPAGTTAITAALAPTITSNDTRAAFAAQGIVGAAFPIAAVPGLAITTEYRFMALTGTRTYNAGLTIQTPTGPQTRFGSFQLGHDYNNTFLFGIRYNFGVRPPPPPPAPAAVPAPAPSRSYLVFFDWDEYDLTDRARQIIAEAAANSTKVQYTRIEVNGYTDTSGTPKYNLGLSIRRANAVKAELIKDGVPEGAITAKGLRRHCSAGATGPGVREAQNRRVEIIIR